MNILQMSRINPYTRFAVQLQFPRPRLQAVLEWDLKWKVWAGISRTANAGSMPPTKCWIHFTKSGIRNSLTMIFILNFTGRQKKFGTNWLSISWNYGSGFGAGFPELVNSTCVFIASADSIKPSRKKVIRSSFSEKRQQAND